MGFFGEVVTNEKREILVPDAYTLKPANEEKEFAICHIDSKSGSNCVLQHEFGPEDSPIVCWTTGDAIHLTGNWIWDIDEDEHDHDHCDSDDSSCDDEEEKTSEVESDPEPVPKKRGHGEISEDSSETTAPKKTTRNKRGKSAESSVLPTEEIVSVSKLVEDDSSGRKRWKVKPQNDEGVSVPTPKQRAMTSGVLITDHVIGKGECPRLGSTVGITYDGLFPDGTVFDSNQRRSKPLRFRLGSGQVIRGLDLGMEGMRVGGSREIVVPSTLGYGKKGVGDSIPGNQTLVFRITLIGSKTKKKK